MSPPPALLIAAARLRVDEIAARSSAFRDRVRGLSQLLLERINSSRLGRELVHPALHCVPEEEVERVQIGTALRELHGDNSRILLRRESFVGLLASGVVVLERPVGALVAVNNLQRPLERPRHARSASVPLDASGRQCQRLTLPPKMPARTLTKPPGFTLFFTFGFVKPVVLPSARVRRWPRPLRIWSTLRT